MRILLASCILALFCVHVFAQNVVVFGAENHDDIKVTSSSFHGESVTENLINGNGLDARKMEAGRFLAQAGFGGRLTEIEEVQNLGYEGWIDHQVNLPKTYYSDQLDWIWSSVYQMRKDAGVPEDQIFGPLTEHFNYSWWQNIIPAKDQLRHKIAFALSQILVVSSKSDLRNYARALASYYDILYDQAFGNYKDLLYDITMHPAMGYYLSHLNNPKADDENVIRPDENYAREIMQLFSIGLHQLNQNGTIKITADGRPIPTYDANDIRELAKVFTGLGPGAVDPQYDFLNDPYFGLGFWAADKTVPMVMYDEYHETAEKKLINGLTLPANQSGMDDIEATVEHLFNHPNVGPFVSRQLIQRLVTSNPSPGYIARVSSVFNDNGYGTRGDLLAVVKAILLDDEARLCEYQNTERSGKLKEPIVKYAQLARNFDLISPHGRYWDPSAGHLEWTGQMAMSAPSVFNFYEPDFKPAGELTQSNLVGPEFKILNSKTSIGYINAINAATIWDTFIKSWELDYGDEIVRMDTRYYEQYADDMERVLNEFDIMLTNGFLSDRTRDEIRTASNGLLWGELNFSKVRMAMYGIMISPDYNILK